MTDNKLIPWGLILSLCCAACAADAAVIRTISPTTSVVALPATPTNTPIPTRTAIAISASASATFAPQVSPTGVTATVPPPTPTGIAPTARICTQSSKPIDFFPHGIYQISELTYLSDGALRVTGLTKTSRHLFFDVGLVTDTRGVSITQPVMLVLSDPCRGICKLDVLSESPMGSIQALQVYSPGVAIPAGGEWFVGKAWAKRWSDLRRGGGRVFWSDDERLVYRYWPETIFGFNSEILMFSGSLGGSSAPAVISLTLPLEFYPNENTVRMRPDDKTLYSIGQKGHENDRVFTAWKVEGSGLVRLWSIPAPGVQEVFWQKKEKRVLLGVVVDKRFYVVPLADDHSIDLRTALIEVDLPPSMGWLGVFGPQVAVSPDLTSIAFSSGREILVYDCPPGR